MFKTILKAKLRDIGRRLSYDWATYFILGPVIMGVAFLMGRKVFNDFAFGIGRIQSTWLSEETAVRLAFSFLVLKIFFNFLPLARRLYASEHSLTVDDLLPINFAIRYKVFYLEQLFRDLPFFAGGAVLLLFFGKTDLLVWPFMIWLFFPAVEIGFTLTWIHFWSPDRKKLAGVFSIFVFLLIFLPVVQLSWWADFFTFLFAPLGYYKGFKVWRYTDMGRVAQFFVGHETRKKRAAARAFFGGLCRIFPKNIRPLVQRDLILTARNFVPHIWRNLVLVLLVMISVISRGQIALEIYCAVGAFVIASTVSPLFQMQRPYRTMDVALPLSAEQVWRAKLTYARLLALPIPFVVWGIEMLMRPLPGQESVSLLLTLLLIGIAVSSLVGGSICEGDQRPVLQYIVAAFLCVLATLFIAVFNPVLFLLLFPILSSLKGSAIIRIENEGLTE
ncbi:MAG: hypothetical protein VST69_05890 [Nitrospirota bacterium]|nr:hypothetical protein [Nitrospirota bacterium]